MPIRIAKREFSSETRPLATLPYLAGCIGELITIKTEFYYENLCFSTPDNIISFAADPETVNTLDNLNTIKIQDDNFFNTCRVGDSIFIPENGTVAPANHGTFQITEILSGGVARFNHTFTNEATDDTYIANVTPFSGIRYAYNLLEAGINYNSLTDSEYQEGSNDSISALIGSELTLILSGKKSYQIGDITITGLGLGASDTQQRFLITHHTVITPFFLANQYADLLLRKKPAYYEAEKCLNYISKISIGRSLNDTNGLTVIDIPDSIGNTGWFNENFNGKPSGYVIDSLSIKKVSDGTSLDALIFGADVLIEAVISNANISFLSGTTPVIFGFNYLPEDETLYQNNGFDQTRNFLFDSKKVIVGSGVINGNNNGTAIQVIKTVQAVFIDSKHIKLSVVINFGSQAQALMSQGDFKRYMFWVINDNVALPDEKSDKVNTLLQVSEIYQQLVNTNLITQDTVFLEHPYATRAFGISTPNDMFPVDDVVADTAFNINYTGKEADGIIIKSISPRIKLKHNTNSDILLEEFVINCASFMKVGTMPAIQDINFSQEKVYKREDGIRKRVICVRDYNSDFLPSKIYSWLLAYPFMNRWEYWIPLQTTGVIPADLFDSSKPSNGLNHLWNRLANIAGWSLNYEITFEIEQNGILFEQQFNFPLTSRDFNSNPAWINNEIESFDTLSNTLIQNGSTSYIQGFIDTKIIATFTKASGDLPSVGQVAIVIWIESFEGQGISDIRMISTVYEATPLSWFKSIDNSNKVKIDKSGNVYTGTCLIDCSKLPGDKKFTIYARIYELTGIDTFEARITNDLIYRTTNNGDIRFYR